MLGEVGGFEKRIGENIRFFLEIVLGWIVLHKKCMGNGGFQLELVWINEVMFNEFTG